jgi:hypothetical protein
VVGLPDLAKLHDVGVVDGRAESIVLIAMNSTVFLMRPLWTTVNR